MDPEKMRESNSGEEFLCPKSTLDWDRHFVEKLGVNFKEEDIYRIITSEWSLFHLDADDYCEIDRCVNACNLKLDYESLESLPPNIATPIETFASSWEPTRQQLKVIKSEPLLEKFLLKLEEFNYCLAQIIAKNKPNTSISDWKYQVLFEKLLQLFGINTWTQPFIETKKAMIMGRTMSSKADLLCCRTDPGLQRPVLCVCEVRRTCHEEDFISPPKKPRVIYEQDAANNSKDDLSIWSKHIGDLFLYLDKSPRNEGILGITLEKTWVRFTFLKVKGPCLEEIRNRPGNKPGPVNVEEEERPIFRFSRGYNYLKQDDRKTVFKALLLFRMMQVRFERGATAVL
ncbi:uncharacterized protein LOC133187173 [Saccostrea echinata]|uniref:uncharacterized protein LOC133187173 n=1 Tax=Saccostrea echinata TaxID=191078 RepID=UPI002A83770B|nr:uncharacterized protein LOC133187173 [Saccostrea echinata]